MSSLQRVAFLAVFTDDMHARRKLKWCKGVSRIPGFGKDMKFSISKKVKRTFKTLGLVLGLIASVIAIVNCGGGASVQGDGSINNAGTMNVDGDVSVTDIDKVVLNSVTYQGDEVQPPDLSYSSALYEQGVALFDQAKYDKAIESYEQAIQEHGKLHHADLDLAKIQCSLGLAHKRLGRYEDSVEDFTRALGTLQSVMPSADERSPEERYELGRVYYQRSLAYLEMRDLRRAASDFDESSSLELSAEVDGYEPTSSYGRSSIYDLEGRIATAASFDDDFTVPKSGTGEFNTELDCAFEAFNMALMQKGVANVPESAGVSQATVVEGAMAGRLGLGLVLETKDGSVPFGKTYWDVTGCDVETASILVNRAMVEYLWGWYGSVSNDCDAALALFEESRKEGQVAVCDAYWLSAMATLAASYDGGSDVDMAAFEVHMSALATAAEYSVQWLGECPRTASALESAGVAELVSGKLEQAVEHLEEARAMYAGLGLQDSAAADERLLGMADELSAIGPEHITIKWREHTP